MQRLEAYTAEVHRFVGWRVANAADAQDIAQQTLLVACEKFNDFRGENLRGWLLTIARHLIVDHFRTQDRCQFVEVEDPTQGEAEVALQTGPEAVQEVCAGRERLRCYFDCIGWRLRLGEQVAVLLADVHGYLDKESADRLGMSVASFKLLLHQARARLHDAAGGHCALVGYEQGAKRTGSLPGGAPESNPGQNGEAEANRNGTALTAVNIAFHREAFPQALDWQGCATCRGHGAQPDCGSPATRDRAAPRHRSDGPSPLAELIPCPGRMGCRATPCYSGINCRFGVRCSRMVPRLLALRSQLLAALAQWLGALFA